MKSAIILGEDNGVGLSLDSKILAQALERRGMRVEMPRIRHPLDAFSGKFSADVAFHLERMAPWWWRRRARVHVLIPNQERFPRRLVGTLRRADRIWGKSRHAEKVFGALHPVVEHLGFTSIDRLDAAIEPDYGRFFHLAGRSSLKNTELVLDLWGKHPRWPRLTLVQHPDKAPKRVPPNVDLIDRRVPDKELLELQNGHGVHLCPSLSEGFGHYIVEALSCRAVVLTTDAPPMNELVSRETGVLLPWRRREPRHLGWNFHADPAAMEAAVEELLGKPSAELRALGARARGSFLENERLFARRIEELEL